MAVCRWHRIKKAATTATKKNDLKSHIIHRILNFAFLFPFLYLNISVNFATTMVFNSNWLCAITILLFAAAVQSQVQETTTKPQFTANDQCKYKFMRFFFVIVAVEYQAICICVLKSVKNQKTHYNYRKTCVKSVRGLVECILRR